MREHLDQVRNAPEPLCTSLGIPGHKACKMCMMPDEAQLLNDS
jgi:hypothetical protein